MTITAIYGSPFLPLNKKMKRLLWLFFLRIAWYKLAILTFLRIAWYKLTLFLRIASLDHAILRKKSQNCEFVSRNYEKKSQNCEIRSRNYLFYFLFSGRNRLPQKIMPSTQAQNHLLFSMYESGRFSTHTSLFTYIQKGIFLFWSNYALNTQIVLMNTNTFQAHLMNDLSKQPRV